MKRALKGAALVLGSVAAFLAFAAALVAIVFCLPVHAVMPDPTVTPGEVNPAVTQATIGRTICRAGWTKTIRPKAAYTNALKRKQLATGPYASRLAPRAFEEDHLISLELGGHPTSERNLWPEPYKPQDGMGARVKDQVEDRLKRLVCARTLTLEQAQAEVLEWEATWHKRLEVHR